MLYKSNSGVTSQILDFLQCIVMTKAVCCLNHPQMVFAFTLPDFQRKRNFTVHENHCTETNAVCFYCSPQLRLTKLPVTPTLSLQFQRQPQTAQRTNPKRTMLSKVPLRPQSQLRRTKLMTRAPSPTRRPWSR